MGQRTQYTPGTFSWTDLTTTDPDAAKTFYAALFGWTYDDRPVGDGVVYSLATVDGHSVAAISPQPQQQRDAGAPPIWHSYINVPDADAALNRARELGATVHADAFDVMDAGRMGVVQDPQGAYFAVWEPRATIGAQLVNAPGALCWNELGTPDVAASARFYGDLFGWTTETLPGDMPYEVVMTAAGTSNGGMRPPMPEDAPPSWLVYFATDDLGGALAKVAEHGGQVLMGDTDIGMAHIAVVSDPQGGVFALYHGRLED